MAMVERLTIIRGVEKFELQTKTALKQTFLTFQLSK